MLFPLLQLLRDHLFLTLPPFINLRDTFKVSMIALKSKMLAASEVVQEVTEAPEPVYSLENIYGKTFFFQQVFFHHYIFISCIDALTSHRLAAGEIKCPGFREPGFK